MFLESFDTVVLNYRDEVASVSRGDIDLANIDWDTGKKTREGEYLLADKTYSKWVIKLKEKNFQTITSPVKQNILAFYGTRAVTPGTDDAQWQQTSAALEELRNGK